MRKVAGIQACMRKAAEITPLHLLPEAAVDDQLLAGAQRVLDGLDGVGAAPDHLLKLIQAAGLERNANGLL